MAEQSVYAAVARRGKKAWVVGAVTDNLSALGKNVDFSGTSSISLHETVESAHTKNQNGGNALSVYFNRMLSGSVTLVYVPGERPRAGDAIVYKDPDDGGKTKVMQITDVGAEMSNGMQAATCPVTLEWSEEWQDDEEVLAAIQS